MIEISIEEQINKLRKEGKLKGKVVDIKTEVNKKEYPDFEYWMYDMIKSGVFEEIK